MCTSFGFVDEAMVNMAKSRYLNWAEIARVARIQLRLEILSSFYR